ncbi:MAG TPA: alpha/beta fold hydrolase [Gaiellaceae bacterium]|nr:alpha/beta fold hydrolase [Gaiellaceae bacterium]
MKDVSRSLHAYGGNPGQVAELFAPSRAGPHPVVVVVHGGYWRARYDRSLMDGLCADLAEHGVAAWNLEYRRVGSGGGWPKTFHDVAAGVDALADLSLGRLDLAQVVAVGHSAGGQLAFWLAARPGLPRHAPGARPRVEIRAAVSQAGVLDLVLAATLAPSAEPTLAFLGDPGERPNVYGLASPRERAPLGIPQLVLHGDRDDDVSMEIAESYAAGAQGAGDPCELRVLPGTGHFEHIDPRSEAWRIARDWLLDRACAARA